MAFMLFRNVIFSINSTFLYTINGKYVPATTVNTDFWDSAGMAWFSQAPTTLVCSAEWSINQSFWRGKGSHSLLTGFSQINSKLTHKAVHRVQPSQKIPLAMRSHSGAFFFLKKKKSNVTRDFPQPWLFCEESTDVFTSGYFFLKLEA